ncbi:dUTP diphosphatase [Auraticoccus sp. F435]|uniref:Deoxyuridine 5'-triphosphate nucleotidohydrolase n=1 Tax=Auraticoccus cholistanensis TaxID=2656650 RepID=A0A6A9V0J6_9ACTN|nr:dUTP diphosphatase [Auraticoccus cholistanensis]MVA75729.1 dUTP diphosphatase [Auraticoccus cholistanensis]
MVPVRRLDPGLPLPGYAHEGDAGADLFTAVDVRLEPGERRLVPTGIAVQIPPGWVGLVHPRSGLAARSGLTVVNAPGTVDSGYRGEVQVCLLNTDREHPVELHRGDRIAQLVLQRVGQARFVEVEELASSARATGGHGSSGGVRAWQTSQAEPSEHPQESTR